MATSDAKQMLSVYIEAYRDYWMSAIYPYLCALYNYVNESFA